MLAQGENPGMLHTLYKKIRREECIEADDEASSRGVEGIKAEMGEIEIPTVDEGFSHVYIVTDKGIKDLLQMYGKKLVN